MKEKFLGLRNLVGNINNSNFKNMTDQIADMLTRIRNANLVRKEMVIIPYSKMKLVMAKILEKEGFIKNVERVDSKFGQIKIELKYKNKQPVIRGIKRISKPGQRIYNGYRELPRIMSNLGIYILSTPQGLMTHYEAKKRKLGGEVICEVY